MAKSDRRRGAPPASAEPGEAVAPVCPEEAAVGPAGPCPPPVSCSGCKHFGRVTADYGLCRRYPPSRPSAAFTPAGELLAHPAVRAGDSCGEFAPASGGA